MDVAQTEPKDALPMPAVQLARPVEPVVIGLGSHAYSSWMLNRIGLRSGDFPFDALASDPGMVADIIEDDFQTLMDPREFQGVPDQSGKMNYGHRAYSAPYRRPIIFNGLDPTTEEGRATLEASIDRFRSTLASPGRKIFVTIGGADRGSMRVLQRLVHVLTQRTRDAYVVAIRTMGPEPALPVAQTQLVHRDAGLSVYDYVPRTTMQAGLSFADPRDNDRMADIVRWHATTEDVTLGKAEPPIDVEKFEGAFGRIEEQTAGLRGALADQQAALRSITDQARADRDVRAQTDATIARLEAAVASLSQDLASVRREAQEQQRQAAATVEQGRRAQRDMVDDIARQVAGQRSLIWTLVVLTVLVGAAVAGSYFVRQ